MTNNPGRKPSEERLKRLIATHKIKQKYGSELTNEQISEHLKSDFSISVSRQTLWKDIEWMRTHNIDEYMASEKSLLLEVDRDELTTQLENTRKIQKIAKDGGNTKDYLTATKLMKDIITSRASIDKQIDELKMSESASERPIINLTIGIPKLCEIPKKKKD